MGVAGLVAMSVHLWLVRHGATDWSDAARFCGWTDVPLNEAGRRQARAFGDRLTEHRFAGAWTSDLSRAAETARLAVGGAVPDPRLRELRFGRLEGLRWDECPAPVRSALLAFDGFRAPDGESVEELRERVAAFTEGLSGGDHLVFTHGGVIRALRRGDAEVRPGDFFRLAL